MSDKETVFGDLRLADFFLVATPRRSFSEDKPRKLITKRTLCPREYTNRLEKGDNSADCPYLVF